jgi:2-keto-4-pentenoate hydratase
MRRVLLLLALGPPCAFAGLSPRDIVDHMMNGQPVDEAPALSGPGEAEAFRDRVVQELEKRLGPTVGYKAALTSRAAQKQLGAGGPVLGFLLRDMLLENNAEVPAAPAARPAIEADLVVRVGSESINEARSDAELLAGLDAVIPFVELPDLVFATNVAPGELALTAINAGARAGVLGREVPLSAAGDWPQRLAFFNAELRDANSNVLARAGGGALLGHPLTAIRWIRDRVRMEDRRLKKGDLLSLGSLTAPRELAPGQTYVATYYNLDPAGPSRVQLRVRETSR